MTVQEVDYPALVVEMAAVGTGNMGDVVFAKLREIGSPKWKNEIRYFWTALFNAARESDVVWLWLCTAPHIRRFGPYNPTNTVFPERVDTMPLPEIGGPDDESFEPTERPKQWSSEPTEDNFREQAEALDEFLRAEGEKNPQNQCKSVADYVATFQNSGTGQMMARVQLMENGFHALATDEGISWLIANYSSSEG